MSRLTQLKAAAGSGKTFALTERFLALLGGADQESTSMACTAARPGGYCWPEILAATFTNKAASEMKERVVEAIKRTALNIPEGQKADWSAAKAENTLDNILRRYNQLGIRTIDSTLALLLRVFALEAGLRPDFEIAFDPEPPMQEALEHIVSTCAAGDAEHVALFRDALLTVLRFEKDSQGNAITGFRLEDRLRKRLYGLTKHLMADPDGARNVLTDQQRLADLLVPSFDAFTGALGALVQCIEGHGMVMDKRFTKFLDKCAPVALFDPTPSSKYAERETLEQSAVKNSKPLVSAAAETCWNDFRVCLGEYARAQAVLSRAYAMAPAVELARRMLEFMLRRERETGQVLGSTLPGRVRRMLDGEYGVPDAFCRLGSRLHHLLIDEFQDTSQDQWAAITPLAEECLAKGGSLFYVGDVKQAIYGWRGGDATLFDSVAAQPGLTDMVAEPEKNGLRHNWRSREAVVAFNNDLFTRLAGPDESEQLAMDLFGEAPEACRSGFALAVQTAFADAAQQLPQGKDTEGGYVRIEQLAGGSAKDIIAQGIGAVESLIADDLALRRAHSDICVLVRKKDHASLLCDRLVARGIPVITESSLRLKLHPVPRQLAALLAVADFPGNDLALAQLISGEMFLAESGLSLEETTHWLAERSPGPLHLSFREAFPEAWNRCLAPFVSQAGLMTPYDLASDAARFFQVRCRHPEAELFLLRFLELIHRAGESGQGSLSGFLEFWEDKGDDEKVSLPESVDAVRILTVHKSKGLQYPVVVVPFLAWPLVSDREVVTADIGGHTVLTSLNKSMGAPYYQQRQKEAQEQLNLLYVAFTRAEEELFAFTPRSVRGKAPAHAAMRLLHPLDEDMPVLERGDIPDYPYFSGQTSQAASGTGETIPLADCSADQAVNTARLMSWLPRLRVHRHMEESSFDARMRGEAAHRAMELLTPPETTEARVMDERTRTLAATRARTLALYDFPVLMALPAPERQTLEQELDEILLWALGHADLRRWLAHGRSEASFLDADGDAKRPDFIHFGDGETVILEFKTGAKQPEHAQQTRAYMDMVRAALPTSTVKGVVVYLDLRELEEVGSLVPDSEGRQ